jgi:molecular chaperone DnaK
VAAADKTAVEAAIAELKTAAEGEDTDDIHAKSEALAQISMKIGEALYKEAAEAAADAEGPEGPGDDGNAGDSAGGGGKAEDEVVDADFEEVDDDKKGSAA